MQQTERENFLKNAITIVDYTKDAFVCLVDRYLTDKNWTFEQFLSNNQHEIYHLCYSARCCKCPRGYSPPKRRVLHPSQLDVLFDKLSKLPSCKNASEFCCTIAKNGISSTVLDLSLARCLLINFCLDVFWYSCLQFQNQDLDDFLNLNKHNVYHLWQPNAMCCQCFAGYSSPTTQSYIDQAEWNQMFTTTSIPCPSHRKRGHTGYKIYICAVSAASGISLNQLTPSLQQVIIQHCCHLRKTIDKLVEIRNHDYGHATEGKMSDTDYSKCQTELQDGIMEIAKVCNKEDHFKQKLQSVQKRSLDETLCQQYQNTLLEFVNRHKEFNDEISEIGSRIDTLHGKMASKTKTIPIAIAGKQQKIMDDSMRQMGTSVAETVERGYQENIKMLERFQNQLDELIPKKLKKCSRQSGTYSYKSF
ncbi:Hypothetical predicted protein [Mytilus galloprovincialis]|uniref:Uncharacterized protein n=1 Tax=Mytilus galloprovincialis TaxID=29158 RepID=A0A8B6BIQ9_MYTGA|nr:Hypothetical predicted protein [Mytilus galloprovincialis]